VSHLYNQKEKKPEETDYFNLIGEGRYKIDLKKVSGKGEFPCPKCGTKISPDDETEDKYTIIEPKMKNDALAELVLQCNKCNSILTLTGFLFYEKEEKD